MNNYNTMYLGGIDENGKPVEKSKFQYPYSYDGFVIWRGGKNEEAGDTIYSDRLLMWDHKKHDVLCKRHFGNEGQTWGHREPEKNRSLSSRLVRSP